MLSISTFVVSAVVVALLSGSRAVPGSDAFQVQTSIPLASRFSTRLNWIPPVSSTIQTAEKDLFFPFANGLTSSQLLATTEETTTTARAASPNQEASDGSAGVRQLLGVKGAGSAEDDIWKIRLQLTKPVTWIPLLWGVMCGAAASGNYHWIWNPFDENDRNVLLGLEDTLKAIVAMILAGPFLTGYTQTINDWYDREIDAINEPYRPIPSGAISEGEVIAQIFVLLLGGLGISYGLDVWAHHDFPVVLALSIFGSFISYIYSAPPLKLKQNGWAGNYALGASYISLPWWCGQAVFGQLDRPVYFILYVFLVGICFQTIRIPLTLFPSLVWT
jgi:chlorophyll/bacteriochlorophyll a synthase